MTTKTDITLPPLPVWMSRYVVPADDFEGGEDRLLDDLMEEYARAIERVAIEAYQQQQWVSVEDRLPPDDETWVYAMHIDGVPEIVCGCLIHETRPDGAYSHWMPLPPAPDLPTSSVDNPMENPMTNLRQRGLARGCNNQIKG